MTLLEQIQRYATAIVTAEELDKLLEKSKDSGVALRVKFGIDPTFPHVHVGHAVPIRVLRLFQDHGHLPILILGNATARLGDPTGRNDQRPPLTAEQVAAHAETYLEQIGRILDLSEGKCEIRRNGDWFNKMDFFDGLRLAAESTAARMLERDDFQKRMAKKQPVHLHEMMYPLMQGMDSVEVQADIEIGGNDQLFNLHMGRQLQERRGQRPQVLLTTDLLMGTDGRKMSKTYGNHISLTAEANDVYGKVMSLSDEGMADWFRLLTTRNLEEVGELIASDPRAAKGQLAEDVVTWLFDAEQATAASAEFIRRFQKKEIPDEIEDAILPEGEHALSWVVKEAGLTQSTSDARRLIEGGGVRLDGEQVKDVRFKLTVTAGMEAILLQVGKRKFANIKA